MQSYLTSDVFLRPSLRHTVVRSLPVTMLYLALAWGLIAALPDRAWLVKTQPIATLTVFGIWRFGWQFLHAVRHIMYRMRAFPQIRNEAMSLIQKYPKRLYIMVPSYQEEFQVSQLVFEALIREVQIIPSKVFLYVSVATEAEVEFISKVINSVSGGENVEVVFMYQEQGKRIAMGHALRAIARSYNDPATWHDDTGNDAVIFMDGDTLVEPGTFTKTLPYLRHNSNLGALTTDNIGVSPDAAGVFADWYSVKFAQRNHLFHSHSLSKRILTITGRFSLYRASIVVNEDFIRLLEADYLDHWLFGRFRFLMGDDKSTWFHLLKEGFEMMYVPDVRVIALETRQTHFFRTSLSLMFRWYGNMLRNNWRAIKLGPRPMGGFIWWCILDQRFSSFTPLVGPVSILLLCLVDSWFYLDFYLAWIIITRLAMMWMYVLEGMQLRLLHIPLMVYNQWVGAIIKIYSMHSLDMQSWHKSNAKEKRNKQRTSSAKIEFGAMRKALRILLLGLNGVLLVFLCGLTSGSLALPSWAELTYWPELTKRDLVTTNSSESHSVRIIAVDANLQSITNALQSVKSNESVRIVLPEGHIELSAPLLIDKSNVEIVGAGKGKTIFDSRMSRLEGAAAIAVRGRKGPVVGSLHAASRKGDRVLAVDNWPATARYIWLGIENDNAFFDVIGDTKWRKEKPWVRQFIAEVVDSGKGHVILKDGIPVGFPAGTVVRAARMVSQVSLSDFSVVQHVPDMTLEQVAGVYENSAPEYAVDGVRFDWVAGSRIHNVSVVGAGRHPLVFETSLDVHASTMAIDGAWNKGKGGNGYIRFARAFNCELTDSEVKNIRHLVFQWSSTSNIVHNSALATDVNFHGGYSQNNRVEGSIIEPPVNHPWSSVTRMPSGGAAWAPPDGEGNDVFH
ncbi:glycosyltransferase [Halodesulfovibrio marinisediminis]|uniref:Glycosyltransferase Alg8 n=1 Tax=Halodesulfovibrio marinisediminis DSM 17456 TaxID=1121457 RepID=A0A1N6DW60_9BACT|nr:glycosyltransferase [Halodesulfovibrio marinisediminis]SIN75026.1 glycosyltransferase Alg8 [Halodesulfovibrio marinisediminis DSM 17456]